MRRLNLWGQTTSKVDSEYLKKPECTLLPGLHDAVGLISPFAQSNVFIKGTWNPPFYDLTFSVN
jgi:hypothetical protein